MPADSRHKRGVALQATIDALYVDRVAAEVASALARSGVGTILLKGPSLAAWLYTDGTPRHYEDIDLLVEERSLAAAGRVLGRLGFRRGQPGWRDLSWRWDRPRDGATVDLHRGLVGVSRPPPVLWRELSERTASMRVGGADLKVLSRPALALHVALHAAQHGGEALPKPREDLSRALERASKDCWRQAAGLAKLIGATPALATGLRLDPCGAALARELGLPSDRPLEVALHASPRPALVLAIQYLATAEGLRPRLRFLARKLAPPPAELRSRYELARRGPLGLFLSYLWHPISLAGRLPAGLLVWRRAKREERNPHRHAGTPLPAHLSERLIAALFWGAVRLKRLVVRGPRLERLFYAALNREVFLSSRGHDLMLADRVRNRTYARAIARNVRAGDVVVDLGTGTGVLACLAARQGARKVYAIDHNPVDRARALAQGNQLSNVEFRQIHSGAFDPAEPADVIIQEQIGGTIFDERMIPNVTALRDRILRPGGRILPNRFDIYLEPVELRQERVIPLLWEHRVEGLDFSALRSLALREPRYPAALPVGVRSFARLLCEPRPALSFDLERDGPGDLPRHVRDRRRVTAEGIQHGIAMYFVAHFDAVTRITNAPLIANAANRDQQERPKSWSPLLLRTEARSRRLGQCLELEFTAEALEDPDTWRWKLDGQA
jgi:protein arginine N-methyltransferase 1